MANIGVFCSANPELDSEYLESAVEMGRLIGQGGHRLVYGGTRNGTMGLLADSVLNAGGRVLGIVPEVLRKYAREEDIIVSDLHERLSLMQQNAHGFVALAGGLGTLHEVLDTMASKQLLELRKPIVLVNTKGCYQNLMGLFNYLEREGFIHGKTREYYDFAETPQLAYESVVGMMLRGSRPAVDLA